MAAVTTELDESLSARLERAKALVIALEQGDEAEADRILDEIGRVRESMLFQEIGKLTRQLHEALTGFMVDNKLAELTENDIPDARERLNYVITMTDQAANTTLNVLDEVLPQINSLSEKTDNLGARWERFLQREMPYAEFREMSREISSYFKDISPALAQMQAQLNEVLMAQSFQDLTGQIIRKVIELVQQVENSLIELIRFSSRHIGPSTPETRHGKPEVEAEGPVVPGVDKAEAVSNQDDVDDLLSSLGF